MILTALPWQIKDQAIPSIRYSRDLRIDGFSRGKARIYLAAEEEYGYLATIYITTIGSHPDPEVNNYKEFYPFYDDSNIDELTAQAKADLDRHLIKFGFELISENMMVML
jgi:hypothetical protein